MADEKLDIVLYGATGFVGTLTAGYLLRSAPPDTRIGLAGRSQQRLEELRQRLGGPALKWPIIVADSGDRGALDGLARRTAAVATTVGPYSRYGLPLVAACAEAGTHYADLTGELLFMRRTIDEFDEPARRSGARIVHSTGFDSIPSDLGVLLLHDHVAREGAGDLEDTTFVVTAMRGGVSGGTVESMRNQLKEMAGDAGARRLTLDPYALSPQRDKEPDVGSSSWGTEGDLRSVVYDREIGQWFAPFVMAGVNTRVVRRSNALQDWAYGRRFRYREVMGTGGGPLGAVRAGTVTGGLAAMMGAMAIRPTRAVLDRVLPKPGEGPSEKTRTRGHFRIEIHAQTTSGGRYVATVAAQGDPGYAATAVMFGESALALALEGDRLPPRAGVLTPATAIGQPLIERLRAQGFTFDVRRA
jgi:short subunit dehydrogenase-like uncharacterized protein